MSLIRRYLTGFRGVDTDAPGLFEKDDGTSWYRKPDGSEVEVGGGGFQPVSCILGSGETDVSAPGLYGFKPTGVFNNVYDGVPLAAIPDGLGWSITTDGSDDVITVTESGLYSWTWLVEFADGNDATFTGEMGDSFAIAKKQLNQVVGCQVEDANTTYEFVSGIGQLPAGAQARFFFKTSTAFSTSPYRITSNLSIVRLA